MEVNQSKTTLTEYMTHQKRAKTRGIPPELTIIEKKRGKQTNGHITDSIYCRFLGANLKQNLLWDSHLNTGKRAVLPAVRRHLGGIYSLKESLSFKAKLQLANSFVLSRLLYVISLWGNTSETQVKKAQICLNAAARFVLGAPKIH